MVITIHSADPQGSQKIVIEYSPQLAHLEHSVALLETLTNQIQTAISEKIKINHGELEADTSPQSYRLKLFNANRTTVRHYLVKQQPAGHYAISFLALTLHPDKNH